MNEIRSLAKGKDGLMEFIKRVSGGRLASVSTRTPQGLHQEWHGYVLREDEPGQIRLGVPTYRHAGPNAHLSSLGEWGISRTGWEVVAINREVIQKIQYLN
jgi:hypothetical protein